ncbi:MAG: hypothetical protein FJY97_10145 [candidate division Zixibacteria bacterium]|nr:hypothetical protein [candidate division Zixibacteria bacterium]
MTMAFRTLLIGGRGNIGSGLRTYLPRLDPRYHILSIDLPGAPDLATEPDAQHIFIDLDIMAHPETFRSHLEGFDLIVYLARTRNYPLMRRMTDMVFQSILSLDRVPTVVASSSVHAVDDAYRFFGEGEYATLAERRFSEIKDWPQPIPATLPACPINDYGREKAHVEEWVQRMADLGHNAVAARWGGINARNTAITAERGYFAVWCHQEDAARFVHACYTAGRENRLKNGAHYFVISDNTHNIFDIATPRQEIGYEPLHNAETFYA